MEGDSQTTIVEAYSGDRRELVDFVPTSCRTLLDVGCHVGAFGALLKSQRPIEVWGVEPNSDAAAKATLVLDRVINGFFDDRCHLPDSFFDAITFNDSLEHFADPWTALGVCKAKLTSGGVVIASIPNVRYVENLEHVLFDQDWRYEVSGIRDKTHLRFFTKTSMRRLFEEAGFEVLSQVGIRAKWWQRDKLLRRLVFRLFPRFTEDMRYVQYVTIAR